MIQQQKSEPITKRIDLGKVKIGTGQKPEDINHLHPQSSYLHNFLEPYESYISQLIAQLQDDSGIADLVTHNSKSYSEIGNRILEIVRCTSKADFVFVLSNDSHDDWFIKSQSDLVDGINEDIYIETLRTNVLPKIRGKSVFNPAYHGIYQIHEGINSNAKTFVVIPLISSQKPEIMVVCGLQQDSCFLGDAYSRILSTFYQASQTLPFQPALIEAAILDGLRKNF